jgi:hypothetical protein
VVINGQPTAWVCLIADALGCSDQPLIEWVVSCVEPDAAILVKQYGTPLHARYMMDIICREDVGRLRFAVSQGQKCRLPATEHATLLNEVLLVRKGDGSIHEADRKLISDAVRSTDCVPFAKKVLAHQWLFV